MWQRDELKMHVSMCREAIDDEEWKKMVHHSTFTLSFLDDSIQKDAWHTYTIKHY